MSTLPQPSWEITKCTKAGNFLPDRLQYNPTQKSRISFGKVNKALLSIFRVGSQALRISVEGLKNTLYIHEAVLTPHLRHSHSKPI